MKVMHALIAALLVVASVSSFADNPYGTGAGKAGQEQKTYQHETGQGAMEQERHREKAHKEVGKATGNGPEQGQSSGQEQDKKWWKFWE